MTTPVQQKLRDKKRAPSRFWIWSNQETGFSQVRSVVTRQNVCKELAKRIGPKLNNIEIWNYANFFPHPGFLANDAMQEFHCFHEYFFFP